MFAVLVAAAIGLGLYALHLKRKVARDEQLAAQQQLEKAPPGNGPPTLVTLYVASDSDATLRKSQMSIVLPAERSERARAVLRALFGAYLQSPSTHPIGAGADVRDVSEGAMVYMPPLLEHGIKAKTEVVMLLVMIKGK